MSSTTGICAPATLSVSGALPGFSLSLPAPETARVTTKQPAANGSMRLMKRNLSGYGIFHSITTVHGRISQRATRPFVT